MACWTACLQVEYVLPAWPGESRRARAACERAGAKTGSSGALNPCTLNTTESVQRDFPPTTPPCEVLLNVVQAARHGAEQQHLVPTGRQAQQQLRSNRKDDSGAVRVKNIQLCLGNESHKDTFKPVQHAARCGEQGTAGAGMHSCCSGHSHD
jgi:hypothetical protein